MAHWAKLDENNKVTKVLRCNPDGDEGYSLLIKEFGGVWVKTSYNAHINGFRKTFAGIGSTYDAELDAFIPPSLYPSWVFNKDSFQWEAPVPLPEDTTKNWAWDEDGQTWIELPEGIENDNS